MLLPLLLASGPQASAPKAPPLQAPPLQAPPNGRPTAVAGVTVKAPTGEPAKLVSSYPAAGAAIPGGTTVVKLTFDQPMSPGRWSYGGAGSAGLPRCMDRPRLLNDNRTFVLLCVTTAKGGWTLRLNGDGTGFATAGGRPLAPTDLSFTTTDDPQTTALADAIKAAGLGEDEGPIVNETAQARTPASAVTATPAPPPT